jgi:hypothetical protein
MDEVVHGPNELLAYHVGQDMMVWVIQTRLAILDELGKSLVSR